MKYQIVQIQTQIAQKERTIRAIKVSMLDKNYQDNDYQTMFLKAIRVNEIELSVLQTRLKSLCRKEYSIKNQFRQIS